MKRVILVVMLIAIAGVAGIVRSHSHAIRVTSVSELPQIISGESDQGGEAREEIRKSYELSPGARVEVSGINGAVKIETSENKTAEVYIERTAKSREALGRRNITIQNSSNNLAIRGERGDVSFLARLFCSEPSERVTLKVPRQISLDAHGINGQVIAGEIEGAVEVHGINGKVDIAHAGGSAEFHGINGNVLLALKQLDREGMTINGINGNIVVTLGEGVSAELEAHGMNGNVVSDLPEFVLEKAKHGSYSAHVGTGGNSISAHGINGNIRLTRVAAASNSSEAKRSTVKI